MAEVRRRRVLEKEACKFKHLVSVLGPKRAGALVGDAKTPPKVPHLQPVQSVSRSTTARGRAGPVSC